MRPTATTPRCVSCAEPRRELRVRRVLRPPLVLGACRRPGPTPRSPHLGQAAWQRVSCGDGAKGRRWYDWAWIRSAGHEARASWLLARRSISDPTRPGLLHLLRPTGRSACRAGAGRRIPLERSRNASRPPRTRSAWTTTRSASTRPGTGTSPWPWSPTPIWPSWPPGHLPTQALTPTRARPTTSPHRGPCPPGTIAFQQRGRGRTRHAGPAHRQRDPPPARPPSPAPAPPRHRIRWSHWRRRHQARARRSHYQRQRRHIDH